MAPGEFFSEGRRIIEEKDYLNSRGFCYSSCLCLIILLWQHCRFFHMAVAGQERMDLKWENVGTCWGEVGITLGARLWDLGSGIWDLVSQIKDLGSGLWYPGLRDLGSGFRDLGSGIWCPRSGIWDLGRLAPQTGCGHSWLLLTQACFSSEPGWVQLEGFTRRETGTLLCCDSTYPINFAYSATVDSRKRNT